MPDKMRQLPAGKCAIQPLHKRLHGCANRLQKMQRRVTSLEQEGAKLQESWRTYMSDLKSYHEVQVHKFSTGMSNIKSSLQEARQELATEKAQASDISADAARDGGRLLDEHSIEVESQPEERDRWAAEKFQELQEQAARANRLEEQRRETRANEVPSTPMRTAGKGTGTPTAQHWTRSPASTPRGTEPAAIPVDDPEEAETLDTLPKMTDELLNTNATTARSSPQSVLGRERRRTDEWKGEIGAVRAFRKPNALRHEPCSGTPPSGFVEGMD